MVFSGFLWFLWSQDYFLGIQLAPEELGSWFVFSWVRYLLKRWSCWMSRDWENGENRRCADGAKMCSYSLFKTSLSKRLNLLAYGILALDGYS